MDRTKREFFQKGMLAACATLALFALISPVHALTNEQIAQCESDKVGSSSPDVTIQACTALLRSGRWSGTALTPILFVRGLAYLVKRDYDHAIIDLNEAIRLDPKDPDAFDKRGRAYFYKQDYDHAIADFTEVIRLYPKHASAHDMRGLAWANKGDLDRAIADYTEAIRLDPNYALAYYDRGVAKQQKGDQAGGDADIAAAKKINPNIGN